MVDDIIFHSWLYSLFSYCLTYFNTVNGEGKGKGRWIGVWHINQGKETEPHQQEERKLNPANVESGAINLTWSLPRKKGTSGENMGEIQIYYWISALILQKSLKGKCLNTLASNLTPFYPPFWRGTGWDNIIMFSACPNSFSDFTILPFRTACKHYVSWEKGS